MRVFVTGATGYFGWFAYIATMDNVTSSAWTRKQLGWQPTQVGLLADLDRPEYFAIPVLR